MSKTQFVVGSRDPCLVYSSDVWPPSPFPGLLLVAGHFYVLSCFLAQPISPVRTIALKIPTSLNLSHTICRSRSCKVTFKVKRVPVVCRDRCGRASILIVVSARRTRCSGTPRFRADHRITSQTIMKTSLEENAANHLWPLIRCKIL